VNVRRRRRRRKHNRKTRSKKKQKRKGLYGYIVSSLEKISKKERKKGTEEMERK
jgi:hypothetical protein